MLELAILCGGLGTRIKSVSGSLPKCLLPISGTPVIERILAHWIYHVEVERIVMCVSHLANQIIDFMGDSYKGIPIAYSFDNLRGSGGALENAAAEFSMDEVCLINGDTLYAYPPDRFLTQSRVFMNSLSAQDLNVVTCSLTLDSVANTRFDLVQCDINTKRVICGFDGSGDLGNTAAKASGVHVGWVHFKQIRATFDEFKDRFDSGLEGWSLEKHLLKDLVNRGDLATIMTEADFFDIGVPEDYYAADQFFRGKT